MTIKNGGAVIQALIDAAAASGTGRAEVRGCYEIEKTIVLPSDFTLVLEDCRLTMAEGTFCNMFTNAGCLHAGKRIAAAADHDIHIEGRGRVILDGGVYNGLSEQNQLTGGRPHISVNNLLLFVNVERFHISGLHIRNQRWWAMNFLYCRFGVIRDIDFCADDTMRDENGNLFHGLSWTEHGGYGNVCVKNADGIDLRLGCHDILLENITGFTEDDTVALTALHGDLEQLYAVEDLPDEIHNVTIRSVNAAAYCAIIRLLNQGGTRLYNILIDGVTDASAASPHLDRGEHAVRIGDKHPYGGRQPMPEELFNIIVRNVFSRARFSLRVSCPAGFLHTENILTFDGGGSEIRE